MTDKEQEFLMRELKSIQNFCKTHKSCIECLFVDVGINSLNCKIGNPEEWDFMEGEEE